MEVNVEGEVVFDEVNLEASARLEVEQPSQSEFSVSLASSQLESQRLDSHPVGSQPVSLPASQQEGGGLTPLNTEHLP